MLAETRFYETNALSLVQTGVTLIELMIVLVIVSILIALAVPTYQSYVLRSQLSEGFQLAADAKSRIEEYYLVYSALPTDREQAGMSASAADTQGNYVNNVNITAGVVSVTYKSSDIQSDLANKVLSFTPYNGGSSIIWSCGKAGQPSGASPISGVGNVSTTVEDRYLPASCKP